ncbi:hypothetical protein SPBR_09004 [Sporothrix brasiliensis 5110]|uniref:14-3-3 domain-containing protein n=1 Tax=Sporothrix brasiliensis 5110 TaxID=1398154 RepID=A0A0C2ES60_9PEZI|nr:uncharacterized protein SPBR_09004 [Sporothrix brasiliensis 5110]KIH89164.1 hypothetical protein SPBR_09004 [Sporothrix brasiliensis 5110]
MGLDTPDLQGSSSADQTPPQADKGKGVARDDDLESTRSSLQPTHAMEGGPVNPPPGFGPEPPAAFLLPAADYLPLANRYFKDAISLAEGLLWGSHSLRLSVKTEYASFLYECVHDAEGSRKLAKDTITEVYDAPEGIDNDMFSDACELVTVLGKMMKRGLSTSSRAKGSTRQTQSSSSRSQQQSQGQPRPPQQQQQQQRSPPRQPETRSATRANVPPPIPPTTSVPLLHPDEMVEFI